MQTICFDFTSTRRVIAGKFSGKPHGTYRCHIWTQYGPYITILAFLCMSTICFIYTSKVCSVHFINKETPKNNPYSKKHFGYESSSKVKNVTVKKEIIRLQTTKTQRKYLSYLLEKLASTIINNNKNLFKMIFGITRQ